MDDRRKSATLRTTDTQIGSTRSDFDDHRCHPDRRVGGRDAPGIGLRPPAPPHARYESPSARSR